MRRPDPTSVITGSELVSSVTGRPDSRISRTTKKAVLDESMNTVSLGVSVAATDWARRILTSMSCSTRLWNESSCAASSGSMAPPWVRRA